MVPYCGFARLLAPVGYYAGEAFTLKLLQKVFVFGAVYAAVRFERPVPVEFQAAPEIVGVLHFAVHAVFPFAVCDFFNRLDERLALRALAGCKLYLHVYIPP